jgi:hypothetical protein
VSTVLSLSGRAPDQLQSPVQQSGLLLSNSVIRWCGDGRQMENVLRAEFKQAAAQ